jgi:hypothetical protein
MTIFNTNLLWVMNVSSTDFGHTSHSALTPTGLWMYHQKFSHTSHSALKHNRIRMYRQQNSVTLHIQHQHTRLRMYRQLNSATLHIQQLHTLDYACITNRIQVHFTFSTKTHYNKNVTPKEFSHTLHSAPTHWIMYHQQNSTKHFTFSTKTLDYVCITNRIQQHFTFSTKIH